MSLTSYSNLKLNVPPEVLARINALDLDHYMWKHRTLTPGHEGEEMHRANRKAWLRGGDVRTLGIDRDGVRFWIITQARHGDTTVELE